MHAASMEAATVAWRIYNAPKDMDNTKRFSNRVDDYKKFRPSYPDGIIALLEREIGLNRDTVIADIGSGTGISSIPFLKNGNVVYGVEPNPEMRKAQELLIEEFPLFKSFDGKAEQTTLPNHSVDVILGAQSFHWFANEASKQEFARILKPDGRIVLVWNARSTKSSFQREYEQILHDLIDEYKSVNHRNIQDLQIVDFFSPLPMKHASIDHEQSLDLEGLKGRLKSTSYCPKEGELYDRLMQAMEDLFKQYQEGGRISFAYETLVYWC